VFKVQEIANIAWAFATLGQIDGHLFTELAKVARRNLFDFEEQHLANTAWAFAAANFYSRSLFGPAFANRCEAMAWSDPDSEHHLRKLHQ